MNSFCIFIKTITFLVGYISTNQNVIVIKQPIWNRIYQKKLVQKVT